MTSTPDAMAALEGAIDANDAAAVARVLEEHSSLAGRLNEALPHGAFGATALLRAVHKGNRDMIDVLLRAGADINQRSHWWAGSFGVLDHDGPLSSFLIERGATVDAHAAARLGRLGRLRELVAADPAVVHARGGDGQTPLHFASSAAVADFLLDHGADIDARDIDHESTPAQWMIRDRQPVVRRLVERGCSTDILMASALGDAALVRAHLDATPSSVAMRVTDAHFPKRDLRSAGSIYIWTLGANLTPHQVARAFGHDHIYQLLMTRTPDALKLAIAGALGDEAAFDALLAAQPGLIRALDAGQLGTLVDAAEANDAAAVRLMISRGWPAGARAGGGATALHWASFHGNAEMARELLAHGAPVDVKDETHGAAPMGWAMHGSVHGWHCRTGQYETTIRILREHGAKE